MPLPRLDRAFAANHDFSDGLSVDHADLARELPERVLQFGEGNFLRGFVDWMIDRLNRGGLFQGRVVVIQPIERGLVDRLNEQDGLYTLILRGVRDGRVTEEKELIGSIARGINPYVDYDAFLGCARNPDLRFVVSNTTEAGIALSPSDRAGDRPPTSFPAKLTAFLHERWKHFSGDDGRGLVMLPCELIERNGDALRSCVLETARAWGLPAELIAWIERANVFTNTLVDRIVTGYPRDEAAALTESLGYDDSLLDTGEIFHAWAIEGPAGLENELPFARAGLNVVWTDDVTPYRDRKVRILNGAHTMTVLAAYLAGRDTVKECMDDPTISEYLRGGLYDEIIPTLDLPRADLDSFAAAVLERFSNPFVRHELLSIALNSTSKFAARVLPSLREYRKRKGALPARLTFSLAALLAFYRGTELRAGALVGHRQSEEYLIRDDARVLEAFRDAWSAHEKNGDTRALVQHVFEAVWPAEALDSIPGLINAVTHDLESILARGPAATMAPLTM